MLKMSLIGTRPEAIKMAPVIQELEKHGTGIASSVCITARHRELLDDPAARDRMARSVNPYGDGRASARIVRELLKRAGPA